MKKGFLTLVLVALLAGGLGTVPSPARATGFVVNSDSDDNMAHDKNPGDGQCASWFDECTLRAAIEEANAHAGADTITFQSAMYIILDQTEGALPALTDYTVIDASSVWDSANDQPGVTLHGGGMNDSGLTIQQKDCEVYGLFIINFGDAILVKSSNNTIGGPNTGQRNVLSSNTGSGVFLLGSSAMSNTVQYNYIGLSASGESKAPNRWGVYISEGASANTIQYNWLSGNTESGVNILFSSSRQNEISANYIGLAKDNTTPLGNGTHGVAIVSAAETRVQSNLIAHNGWCGIVFNQAPSTYILDNAIHDNGKGGIWIFDSSDAAIYFNAIYGNQEDGVMIDGASALRNEISANSIYGNGGKGIALKDGGNASLAAPTITSANSSGASGTVAAGVRSVEIYSDSADEGKTHHKRCSVNTITNQWTCSTAITGPNVTALAFDVDGNTSEFSTPYSLGHKVFLPLVLRNR
ncbi:MAG TPA: right-handed parallel beta-helix repeat-containing protein [Anaerolineae bacterium]|nr:right-handed parallel beta-helix repeat-containing protein [Anaerolineae bacterium]